MTRQVAVMHSAFEETTRCVALVEVGDILTDQEALEYAFQKTNNMMGSWSMGKIIQVNGEDYINEDYCADITVMAPLPVSKRTGEIMGLRSTSVGDTMLIDTKMFKVDDVGFKEIV